MVSLKRELKVDIEYGCIFGCVGNAARYMNMDLKVMDIYIYGGGINQINYIRDKFSIGNPLQFEIMMAGMGKFNVDLRVCDRNPGTNPEAVWEEDRAYLCRDKPVIICFESGYLDYNTYFTRNKSMNHTVLLTGIDSDRELIRIADVYIPTQNIQSYIGEFPLRKATEARKIQNYTSLYFEGSYNKPQSSIHEEFFESIRHYMNPDKIEGVFEGIDLIPAFSHDLYELSKTIDTDKISELANNIYFDIKMRGILTHRSIIGEYLAILNSTYSGYEKSVLMCIQYNDSIQVLWNRIMKKLIRWVTLKNHGYIDEILECLKQIYTLDVKLMNELLSIGNDLRLGQITQY